MEQDVINQLQNSYKFVDKKLDRVLSNDIDSENECKRQRERLIALITKNHDALAELMDEITAKANVTALNLTEASIKIESVSDNVFHNISRLESIENNIDKLLKNNETHDINQKLDKIFNKISSLDNDVNKKEYVINDDRVEIIKNLIKDERARHIVLNMEFEGADLSLRIDDSDIRVFKQIFVDNEYDSLNLPETAKTIIDLGANIGLSVFFFIKKFPDARIVAVEPDAVNFSIMEKNLEKFSKSVSLLQAAIWPTDGEVTLVTEDDNHASLGAWGVRTEASNGNPALSVKAVSIPTIMKQYDMDFVDILKVDIEGAEYELFEKNYEDWIDKVGLVIIETHDRFKPNSEAVVRKALKGRFDELPMKGENLFFKKK
ncbi:MULTISPECIES: FkbM family methyltransferase [Bartonella]|uniref:FkbM family methyltransferase n=1 Tax=Bartonella TaxID=773 RepID=UPI0018DB8B0D|nr:MULTISPECIES: FkbM family methyltransferase [Bartonella]MBH9974721.1 FkbM family methyltransferase [Bartonella choladocola]MBI0014327.1 FkbM family methyltransferase [Bartonella sp. B10834G3]